MRKIGLGAVILGLGLANVAWAAHGGPVISVWNLQCDADGSQSLIGGRGHLSIIRGPETVLEHSGLSTRGCDEALNKRLRDEAVQTYGYLEADVTVRRFIQLQWRPYRPGHTCANVLVEQLTVTAKGNAPADQLTLRSEMWEEQEFVPCPAGFPRQLRR